MTTHDTNRTEGPLGTHSARFKNRRRERRERTVTAADRRANWAKAAVLLAGAALVAIGLALAWLGVL